MAALYAGSITSNLKFTTKVPLLMKATSNDEKPTQGFDLQEISRISKSSLSNCQSLLTFLLGRLEKKDPRIKFKVLHLMKYLVINGHSEFRSQLRRNAEAVKQTIGFKGEMDPVHGDGLNVKVQQTAVELDKLLFDVDNPEIEIIYKSMSVPEVSGTKMQGFGYTAVTEPKKETSLKDTLMKVKKSGSEIFKINKPKENFPIDDNSAMTSTEQPQYTPVDLADSVVEINSNSADESDDSNNFDENEVEINSYHYYERKLVKNITKEGGITRIPSKEMLKDFVNKSTSLEMSVILVILNERLQNPSHNVQLKSLCVIEHMLRSNLSNIPRQINEYCPHIRSLVESQDQTVKAKANKIVLAVASFLKRDHGVVSRVPPSYNDAKELPIMKDKNHSEIQYKGGKKTDRNSLFSGMNLSDGNKSNLSENCQPKEPGEPLINIRNTTNISSLENSNFSPVSNTNGKGMNERMSSNSLSSKETNRNNSAKQFDPATHSTSQSSTSFDLMSLDPSGRDVNEFSTPPQNRDLLLLETNMSAAKENTHKIGKQSERNISPNTSVNCDQSLLQNFGVLRETGQESSGKKLMKETTRTNNENKSMITNTVGQRTALNSNNMDLLNWTQTNNASSAEFPDSTQNAERLLLSDTTQTFSGPTKGHPQNPYHPQITAQGISQNANPDLLNFKPRAQAPAGRLVPPTNTSSSTGRRPFPKDMKSEVGGFAFIRNSTRPDAFSFVNEEIQASKSKPK